MLLRSPISIAESIRRTSNAMASGTKDGEMEDMLTEP